MRGIRATILYSQVCWVVVALRHLAAPCYTLQQVLRAKGSSSLSTPAVASVMLYAHDNAMLACLVADTMPCWLMHVQLGRTLVFETLQQGAAYRQLVTQQLRGSVPDVVSLDGGRLAASGMVAGSGFQVVPLQEAACCFGSSEAGVSVSVAAA